MVSPGIVIAALRGGSGKTIFSVGIIAALKAAGRAIAPFKKGPDYIDAGWLALAAGRPCYNLDTYLIDKPVILDSYSRATRNVDLAVIEGNRGLYDSIDRKSKTSTGELAKWLGLPVILCIDGTKTTRTMAAVVLGCMQFDPAVKIRGVVLNRVAGKGTATTSKTASSTTAAFRFWVLFQNSKNRHFQSGTWAWCPPMSTNGPRIPFKRFPGLLLTTWT